MKNIKNIMIVGSLVAALCSNLALANDEMTTLAFDCGDGNFSFEAHYSDSKNWEGSVTVMHVMPTVGFERPAPSIISEIKNCAFLWTKNASPQISAVKCYDVAARDMFELERLGQGKILESTEEGEKVFYSDIIVTMTHYRIYDPSSYSDKPKYWGPWSNISKNATCTHRVMPK